MERCFMETITFKCPEKLADKLRSEIRGRKYQNRIYYVRNLSFI